MNNERRAKSCGKDGQRTPLDNDSDREQLGMPIGFIGIPAFADCAGKPKRKASHLGVLRSGSGSHCESIFD